MLPANRLLSGGRCLTSPSCDPPTPCSVRLASTVLPCFARPCSGRVSCGRKPRNWSRGDLVAVCGDSITEQRIYSMYLEEYLLACQPAARLQAAEFGWGGETAAGFLPRMENDVLGFKPDVVTLCYGMNDAGYVATDAGKLADYRKNLDAVVKRFKAAGVRDVIVGTPGAVGHHDLQVVLRDDAGRLQQDPGGLRRGGEGSGCPRRGRLRGPARPHARSDGGR